MSRITSTAGLEMQVSEDSGFADVSWESFESPRVFTLTPQNGSKTVYARLRDQAGVMSATASTTIVYDDIDPVLLGVNGDYELIPLTGCAYAERGTGSCEEDASMKHFFSEGETTIPLVVTDNLNGDLQVGTAIDEYGHTCGSNAVTYYNYENGRVVIKFPQQGSSFDNGIFNLTLCVRDEAGNTSDPMYRWVILDETPPEAPANVTVVNGSRNLEVTWGRANDAPFLTSQ